MSVLSEEQRKYGYFKTTGGFPSLPVVHTVAQWDGSEVCCIACTQLQGGFPDQPQYTDRERKQILRDWISLLSNQPDAFTALHFNSHVPQALFDAVCSQRRLRELRLKWGRYADLSRLRELKQLQFLYLGSCPGVQDLSPIPELEELVVLFLENFRKVTDYSPLARLDKLEQLVISGPTLGTAPVRDLDFLCEMKSLSSVWFPGTTVQKPYSREEKAALRTCLKHLVWMYDGI